MTPSYMLIADDSIPLASDYKNRLKLIAHLKHALLFQKKIILTDTQIINNQNFRLALKQDKKLIELFNHGNLTIARRDFADFPILNKGEKPITISQPRIEDIIESFLARNKFNWKNPKLDSEKLHQLYLDVSELNALSKVSENKYYNLREINNIYTEDVLKIFQSENSLKLIGVKLSNIIAEQLLEEREYHKTEFNKEGGVGINFFTNKLPEFFRKHNLVGEWTSKYKSIIDLARAPYITAFPKAFNANPIYGQMHKHNIDLVRSIKYNLEQVQEIRDYKSYLLNFEEGVLRLSPSDIFKLRESEENKNYHNSINKFDGSEGSLNEVLFALHEYKILIDERILNQFQDLKETKKGIRERIKPMQIIYESPSYASLTLAGMALATISFPGMNLLSLGLGLLSLYTPRLLDKRKKKITRIKELKKERGKADIISKFDEKNKIDNDIILKTNSIFEKEVFYSSIKQ